MQRAQYEAEQARIRFMRVDPNNRLVADTLETQWNEKLRLLAQAKDQCEQQSQRDSTQISAEQRAQVLALASQFPKLWNDPQTADRDRKRMARLLLEDVTLRRDEDNPGAGALQRRRHPTTAVETSCSLTSALPSPSQVTVPPSAIATGGPTL